MRVSVFGLGYVGVVYAVGLAYLGHEVLGYDVDKRKVEAIRSGGLPIYEPGLDDLWRRAKGFFTAVEDPRAAVDRSDLSLVAVGTPSAPDGSADLRYVREAVYTIAEAAKRKGSRHLIVIKSTVPPGTTAALRRELEGMGYKYGVDFDMAMNPEFLREGSAVEDFLKPDRVVLGFGASGLGMS